MNQFGWARHRRPAHRPSVEILAKAAENRDQAAELLDNFAQTVEVAPLASAWFSQMAAIIRRLPASAWLTALVTAEEPS